MAMMEHECKRCGHAVANNYARHPTICPICGSLMQHYCDEAPADWEPEPLIEEDDG